MVWAGGGIDVHGSRVGWGSSVVTLEYIHDTREGVLFVILPYTQQNVSAIKKIILQIMCNLR